MQKKIFILLVAVILTMEFNSQAFSMGKRGSVKKIDVTNAAPQILIIKGAVLRYNLKNSTITISTNAKAPFTAYIDKNTTISRVGTNIRLKDVKEGDLVAVMYEIKKGKNIAKDISVQKKTALPRKNK